VKVSLGFLYRQNSRKGDKVAKIPSPLPLPLDWSGFEESLEFDVVHFPIHLMVALLVKNGKR
jgi:hypothetical protein